MGKGGGGGGGGRLLEMALLMEGIRYIEKNPLEYCMDGKNDSPSLV